MSVGSFCETYKQKKMKAAPSSLSSRGAPESSSPSVSSAVSGSSVAGLQTEVEDEQKKIESLKKMGFTDSIIQKILDKNRNQDKSKMSSGSSKTTAATGAEAEAIEAEEGRFDAKLTASDTGRPAICSLPGVHAEGLCRAYDKKGAATRAGGAGGKVPQAPQGPYSSLFSVLSHPSVLFQSEATSEESSARSRICSANKISTPRHLPQPKLPTIVSTSPPLSLTQLPSLLLT
jgi:hypothetical protein